MAKLLSGKWVREEILKESKPRVEQLAGAHRPPGLAVVLVGDNPASEIYVRNKVKTCQELGIHSEKHTPPATSTTEEILELVESLNQRPEIDGILVQMPLPSQVDASKVLLAVSPEKDVDGFHPLNMGYLLTGRPGPRACTPAGIMELLHRYEIPIKGRRAVIIGRSDIVGKPMAMLLMHEHATVTICHSRTSNLSEEARGADILVAAIGRPALVTRDFIKPGATVIDVGMNRITDAAEAGRILSKGTPKMEAFEKRGSVLVGDVHPEHVTEHASGFTPVPGGVGPLTIAMLMVNTIQSAERRLGECSG
ncbi:MAG: bifunctional methylenetetrahydrofolate dehydrogenase/methenyltetrahydrofolate cyclohydrolase FolD [bacterium]|nr:bifunctional methylenetetrahydrofolate dehydrogenase/methenyltetrahydrofolate cyclohydrolase FolD [bacterium]